MKNKICGFLLALFVFTIGSAQAGMGLQGGMGPMMGPGMMSSIADSVPAKLPPPGDEAWLKQLHDILALEKLSFIQYTTDSDRYNAGMPYRMVIPQERDHIEAIRRLFAAYGVPADGTPGPVAETKSLMEAYEICIELERDLAYRYERLLKNAPEKDSAAVLRNLLLQTQHHQAMFEHAVRMGGRMGPEMMGH